LPIQLFIRAAIPFPGPRPRPITRHAHEDHDEVVVRATVSRLVVTVDAPAEIVESVVRGELGRRRAKARIQTFVPILTERAARHRLRNRPPT
jgi:hypothetical protein